MQKKSIEKNRDVSLGDNLFLVVNGYSGYQSVGMLNEFRGLPVVLLSYEGKPVYLATGDFLFKNCSLLMLGERVSYKECVLKLVYYDEKISS